MPFEAVTVAEPLFAPLHVILLKEEIEEVKVPVSTILAIPVLLHPFVSVTVTV